MVHCDDLIDDPTQPECLRKFLAFKRAPATEQWQRLDAGEKVPKLFARVKETGDWVRVVMASRFGDVGITAELDAEHGYGQRVHCDALTDFTDQRPWSSHHPRAEEESDGGEIGPPANRGKAPLRGNDAGRATGDARGPA